MPRFALTVRVKGPVEDRKHVGRRAADVDADEIEVLTPCDGFHDQADSGRESA